MVTSLITPAILGADFLQKHRIVLYFSTMPVTVTLAGGLGAILLQDEHVIAYASCVLHKAKCNYSCPAAVTRADMQIPLT